MNSIKSVSPVYGDNYNMGWVGCVFHDDSVISQGIAWFTRPDLLKPDQSPVSHVLVVSGIGSCIEALPQGVVQSSLDSYFGQPNTHIFFRKPVLYDYQMGVNIVDEAEKHLGEKYGYSLLVADAMAGSFVGRILNWALFNWPHRIVSGMLDRKKEQICSELAARSLQADWRLRTLGCLAQPARMITPRMLAFDNAVFSPMVAPT